MELYILCYTHLPVLPYWRQRPQHYLQSTCCCQTLGVTSHSELQNISILGFVPKPVTLLRWLFMRATCIKLCQCAAAAAEISRASPVDDGCFGLFGRGAHKVAHAA